MSLMVFSVYDSKVGAYANPFYVRTRGEAVRSFSDACGDDNMPFKKHPADYILFFLGTFDESTGRLLGVEAPDRVIGADEM